MSFANPSLRVGLKLFGLNRLGFKALEKLERAG